MSLMCFEMILFTGLCMTSQRCVDCVCLCLVFSLCAPADAIHNATNPIIVTDFVPFKFGVFVTHFYALVASGVRKCEEQQNQTILSTELAKCVCQILEIEIIRQLRTHE